MAEWFALVASLDREMTLQFIRAAGERATLIGYDDVALGGRQISARVREKSR
jgi:hypothetical protein